MFKQKNPFIATVLLALSLLTGCSQSDGNSMSASEGPLVIDGYTLPPDPGEAGKETLLGIDSNANGVRDDVEIYIYKRFQGFENARKDRAIAIQYAKATQIIIQEPEKAYENKTFLSMENAHDCQVYVCDIVAKGSWDVWLRYSIEHEVFNEEMKDVIFNTRERLEAYMQYNDSLSGHVFDSTNATKEKCEVDIDALGNEW